MVWMVYRVKVFRGYYYYSELVIDEFDENKKFRIKEYM